ncbi:MAG: L,D-transpeptidase family protein [Candidatus Omnitrophica bacterium]|nr:L,D-transpeptidase family protein [Candidatus Omnitrophota bacterium]
MNKKLIFIILAPLLIILLIFFALKFKKAGIAVQSKEGKTVLVSVSRLYNQARELESKGNLPEAKALYQQLVLNFPNSPEVASWQKKCDELNIKLLFSPTPTPKSTIYEIKPGDTLTKIARQFKTTVELIKKSNNISDDKILPGRKLKVWTAPFSIVVDKSQNILILKSDEEIIKTYVVSTGTNNSTPIGTFKIVNKLTNPTWFKAGAVVPPDSQENVLGTRWLGFDLSGYGIHGTTDPQSLGKQVTQGCVRMANPDVEELYAVVPEGTEVVIVD